MEFDQLIGHERMWLMAFLKTSLLAIYYLKKVGLKILTFYHTVSMYNIFLDFTVDK